MRFNPVVFDAHCDTLDKLAGRAGAMADCDCHFNLDKAGAYGGYVQVFAAWTDRRIHEHKERARALINRLYDEERAGERLKIAKCFGDIKAALKEGRVAGIIGIEGAEAVSSIPELLDFYKLGVRVLGPTWNYDNAISGAQMDSGAGLSDFGFSLVREMKSLRMVIDVSHLSDKGFWDIAESADMPFIASHSNARGVCPHKRNLTDEQILAIGARGGAVGLNLCADFLKEGGASLGDVIEHIEHFMALCGEDVLGIGADFDGVDALPRGISGAESLSDIFCEMLRLGYSEETVAKFAGGNFLRVFADILEE